MSKGDTARIHYEMARWELIYRIQLRDNVLLIYLGAISTLFGIYFSSYSHPEILLTIPFISLGASIIIAQHHMMIGAIGHYLTEELEPFYRDVKEFAPQWDSSKTLQKIVSSRYRLRLGLTSVGYNVLINIPPTIALIINLPISFSINATNFHLSYFLVWLTGLLFLVLSIASLLIARKERRRLYKDQRILK